MLAADTPHDAAKLRWSAINPGVAGPPEKTIARRRSDNPESQEHRARPGQKGPVPGAVADLSRAANDDQSDRNFQLLEAVDELGQSLLPARVNGGERSPVQMGMVGSSGMVGMVPVLSGSSTGPRHPAS